MSIKTVKKLLAKDPEFAARFIVNPRAALEDYGIDPGSIGKKDTHALEVLVEQTQDNLRTNSKLLGLKVASAEWGIGAGCCNSDKAAFDIG